MFLFKSAAPVLWLGLCAFLHQSALSMGPQGAVNAFNYVLGTQTFGPKYQFTGKAPLVETAEIIRDMGATVVKFALEPGSRKERESRSGIGSLVQLARDEPSHRQVLDMPFCHFILWVTAFNQGDWTKGLSSKHRDAEYAEIYELVWHLLRNYDGSGKAFYLGHWEGDGMLRHSIARENDARVTPQAVQGMVDWLNARQAAVDDAKRDTPHSGVDVWHYTEVNHVVPARDEDRPAVVNRVLPSVPVDFVSYSAYDTTNRASPAEIVSALNYIESKLVPKPAIRGKRVFIGEYGYPLLEGDKVVRTPQQQEALSRIPMLAGLEWGCPFVLYWELYNNEVTGEGSHRGFWMIDDKGVKQPIFHTHTRYYKWAREFVETRCLVTGKPPSETEFRSAAYSFIKNLEKAPIDAR